MAHVDHHRAVLVRAVGAGSAGAREVARCGVVVRRGQAGRRAPRRSQGAARAARGGGVRPQLAPEDGTERGSLEPLEPRPPLN